MSWKLNFFVIKSFESKLINYNMVANVEGNSVIAELVSFMMT